MHGDHRGLLNNILQTLRLVRGGSDPVQPGVPVEIRRPTARDPAPRHGRRTRAALY